MIDYYGLAGFHCDEVKDRKLKDPSSATSRAARNARSAVRIAREMAGKTRAARAPERQMAIAIKPVRKPYSTI